MSDSTPTPPSPFRLTLAEGIPLLQKAIEEGRLQLQLTSPSKSDPICMYYFNHIDKVCGCAIGVMLPPEVAEALPTFSLRALCQYGYLEIRADEAPTLYGFQQGHDILVGEVVNGLLTTEEAMHRFRNLVENLTHS